MKKSDTCEFKIKTEPSLRRRGRVVFPILMAISFRAFLNDLIQFTLIPSVVSYIQENMVSFLQIGIITLVVR